MSEKVKQKLTCKATGEMIKVALKEQNNEEKKEKDEYKKHKIYLDQDVGMENEKMMENLIINVI